MKIAGKIEQNLEGGGVSKENIGLVISTSVTSRHTSVSFNMAGEFVVLFYRKNEYFPTIWMIYCSRCYLGLNKSERLLCDSFRLVEMLKSLTFGI